MNKIYNLLYSTILGLGILGFITALVFAWGTLISQFDMSKTLETIILFLPLILFASYNMGELRRLNSKKEVDIVTK
jgi:hypothetical protein